MSLARLWLTIREFIIYNYKARHALPSFSYTIVKGRIPGLTKSCNTIEPHLIIR